MVDSRSFRVEAVCVRASFAASVSYDRSRHHFPPRISCLALECHLVELLVNESSKTQRPRHSTEGSGSFKTPRPRHSTEGSGSSKTSRPRHSAEDSGSSKTPRPRHSTEGNDPWTGWLALDLLSVDDSCRGSVGTCAAEVSDLL